MPSIASPPDLLIHSAAEVFTAAGGRAETIANGAVAVVGERISAVGSTADLLPLAGPGTAMLDATGRCVLPGFVDAHTHLVFAGTREREYAARLAGASYQEILQQGGGILSTVEATRAASADQLVELALPRLERMLRHGTTTTEVKSGYGLDAETELRLLRAVQRLNAEQPVELVPTFLGAHAIPREYRGRADAYVDLVIDDMLPRVADQRLARFCDVFCDEGVFTTDQARRVLEAGLHRGLRPKIHAEELAWTGASLLAADLRAASADHLDYAEESDVYALAHAGVVGVLLPGVALALRTTVRPNLEAMRRAGLRLAVATDLNPGTSYMDSMPAAIALACGLFGLTPAEAVLGATYYGAAALDMQSDIGSLEAGKRADVLILNATSYLFLPYHFGANLVSRVIKGGRIVSSS
jgi:imidazolonepropionase